MLSTIYKINLDNESPQTNVKQLFELSTIFNCHHHEMVTNKQGRPYIYISVYKGEEQRKGKKLLISIIRIILIMFMEQVSLEDV